MIVIKKWISCQPCLLQVLRKVVLWANTLGRLGLNCYKHEGDEDRRKNLEHNAAGKGSRGPWVYFELECENAEVNYLCRSVLYASTSNVH